jgi:hypothetical protein
MRTESRIWKLLSLPLAVILFVGLVAQISSSQIVTYHSQPNSNQDPIEASPLSQFNATSNFFKNHQSMQTTGWLRESLVTKQVDLGETLRSYAAFKKCSLNEAFVETVKFLKMVPLRDKPESEMVGAQAIYVVVKQDLYQISAPQKFFDALPLNLMCIANGKRHLSLEIQFVSVPAKVPPSFKSLMIPGSFTSFNNKIAQVTPFATNASYRNEKGASGQVKPEGTFVVASETRTKVFPTFMGRLDDNGVTKLLETVKADENSDLTMAPTVIVTPGQTASVADASTRPFVIGTNLVEGKFGSAHQPVIQPIEEGTMLKLRATGENGKIRVDADLALSQIDSVETFHYGDVPDQTEAPAELRSDKPTPANKVRESLVIQVPEQRLKQVHFSTSVEEGQTIFVDPVFERAVKSRGEKGMNRLQNKKSKDQASRVLLLIKPRWVEAN